MLFRSISFLDPVIGRASATVAIALLTAMAVIGRLLFSTVIDRLNQRLASALSFASGRLEAGLGRHERSQADKPSLTRLSQVPRG